VGPSSSWDYDVAVVGAGPAGSTAARLLAAAGRSVVVIDRARFPRSKPCGGALSPRAQAFLRRHHLWQPIADQACHVHRMRLQGPTGQQVETLSAAPVASILPRERLDTVLLDAARRAGATVIEASRVTQVVEAGSEVVELRSAAGPIAARWVVAADGAGGRFRLDRRSRRLLYACVARFEGATFDPSVLELTYDPALVPHYGWVFPEPKGRVNIGVCVEAGRLKGSIRGQLERFIDRHCSSRLAGARSLGPLAAHPISVSLGVGHGAPPGVLLVGEAAGLANSANGEGISHAMRSGELAAACLDRAFLRQWSRDATVARYRRSLQWELGRRLAAADLVRRAGVPVLDAVCAIGNAERLRPLGGTLLGATLRRFAGETLSLVMRRAY
jgi:geranylgeranyl reductase family protein